ncbi:uncharacterized protein LOC128309180 [Anopheles moucheti]|uniref:uncharacterized protein LOC128309180 n=1 Tax=Anopheles moucheti TaxID=186751 RepID=UPI0022F0F95F|nr:uncharacterized protein LOC128309180 [Anopheles moucheti]
MSEEQTLLFIDMMFRQTALWDRWDANYKNISKRHDDWCYLSRRMGHTVDSLKKKWESLALAYRKCKSAYNKSLVTGSGAHQIYRPTWFAYEAMRFLDTTTSCGQTMDTVMNTFATVATTTANLIEQLNPSEDELDGVRNTIAQWTPERRRRILMRLRRMVTEEEEERFEKHFGYRA